VYIATDPDPRRNIAWHIQQALGIREYKRVTFNESPKPRVREGMANARRIDGNSLPHKNAGECWTAWWATWSRRSFASPGPTTSAGRVQSPALYLVVLRERKSGTSRWSTTSGRADLQGRNHRYGLDCRMATDPRLREQRKPLYSGWHARGKGCRNARGHCQSCEDSEAAPHTPTVHFIHPAARRPA
jgi:reverse gyrase